ncbi:MAG: hypothetical protein H7Y86_00750 [Rhizobacter sp.]|nr:hypothetical protein [Ferruginibacter sp.]
MNCYVAFKNAGSALYSKTALVNSAEKLVDSLVFNEEGLILLQFVPKAGETYFVKWENKSRGKGSKPLPPAKLNGAVLHTEISGNKLFYSISKNNPGGGI